MMRDNDPFSSEYRKPKDFWRKGNKKRMFYYLIIMVILVYGSQSFIDENIVDIEIRTVTERKISKAYFIDGRCEIFIINHSPYKIRLIIDDDIITNYNNEPLEPNIKYYFWFESNSSSSLLLVGEKS